MSPNAHGRAALGEGPRPLVSIVTPVYQGAAFLERTLQSVRAQTYSPIEHIVVDGGSTDGTLDVLRAYEGRYNLRWMSEPDAGMYDAINKGIRGAHGGVMAYLNSDDLYLPWAVESAVESLNERPDADFVFGDIIRIDDFRRLTVPIFSPPYSAVAKGAFGTLSQPAVFWRRRTLEELHGFDSSLRYVADLEFWLRAGRLYRFVYVPDFLAVERRHPAMLSEAGRIKMSAEDMQVRGTYRRGLWATNVGRLLAYVRWHWASGRRWIAFVLAARGRAGGWSRAIDVLRPSISAPSSILGWLPSKGSRLRGKVRWARDPVAVATGEADG